jgi:hypothetical protein
MANTQATFGFKHRGYLGGGAPDYQLHPYTISSSNTTAIGFGDPVGYVNNTSAFVTLASASLATVNPIVGIFQGCYFVPAAGGAPVYSPFWPGAAQGSNGTALVIDAPNALFLVAALNTSAVASSIGNTVNFTSGPCQTVGGGFSIATIDTSTGTSGLTGTTSSYMPFRIVGLYDGVGNGSDPTTPYGWMIVGFNYQLNRSFVAL